MFADSVSHGVHLADGCSCRTSLHLRLQTAGPHPVDTGYTNTTRHLFKVFFVGIYSSIKT